MNMDAEIGLKAGSGQVTPDGNKEILCPSRQLSRAASSSGGIDDFRLSRLGKKPVLKRKFGFTAILGFSCTVLVTWEGILITWQNGYSLNGPAGMIYSFLLVWLGILCTYTNLSELVSMAPTAGGQYHWVSMLAPEPYTNFLSYITAWLTITGWEGSIASGTFNCATFLQTLIVVCNPNYDMQGWATTLISYGILALTVFINVVGSSTLPKFEGLILVLHILGFFAILIPLLYLSPHASAHDVFTTFTDDNGWGSPGYSFFLVFTGTMFAFIGGDSAVHMSEEIKDAATVVPRSLLLSVFINGSLGFAMLVALMFCLGSPEEVADATAKVSTFPFIQIFAHSTGSIPGAVIMSSIVLALGVSATVGIMASASRMYWSFSRDNGFPFSSWVVRLHKYTSIPVNAIILTTIITMMINLVGISTTTAFQQLISLCTVGIAGSYIIVCGLLLWRRVRGDILSPFVTSLSQTVNTTHRALVWGPFHVPEPLGTVVNIISLIFLTIVFIFAFYPIAPHPTADTMNWSCLVFGGVVTFAVIDYFVRARHTYKGPVVEY